MMENRFKAPAVTDKKFYQLEKSAFFLRVKPLGLLEFVLFLWIIVVLLRLLYGQSQYLLDLLILTGLYLTICFFYIKRKRVYGNEREKLHYLLIDSDQLLVTDRRDREKVRRDIGPDQNISLKICSAEYKNKIWDYFRSDFVERTANYIELDGERYYFLIETHFAFGRMLGLVEEWKAKGIKVEVSIADALLDGRKTVALNNA